MIINRLKYCTSILRLYSGKGNSGNISRQFSASQIFSARKEDNLENGITVTRDGSTIVCWHPEEKFPYQFSKPLPEQKPTEVTSVLKVQNKSEIMNVFKEKPKQFVVEELMRLTFTSKHTWKPRQSDKKVKRNEPYRKYL